MPSKPHESRIEKQNTKESPEGQVAPEADEAREPTPEAESPPVVEADARILDAEARAAELERELAVLREELSSVNDKYLRKLADDVNFRKRMSREKEEGQRFAIGALLGDLIPMLDDFDRAIASAEALKDYAVLHDGIVLIRRQLGQVLENKYGLRRIGSQGKPFDPNVHEAVAMEQGGPEDGDEAMVAEEFLPAYGLHERVLRTAKVKVRMPAPRRPPEEPVPSSGGPDGEPGAEPNGDGPSAAN